jgi:hypothetical protein
MVTLSLSQIHTSCGTPIHIVLESARVTEHDGAMVDVQVCLRLCSIGDWWITDAVWMKGERAPHCPRFPQGWSLSARRRLEYAPSRLKLTRCATRRNMNRYEMDDHHVVVRPIRIQAVPTTDLAAAYRFDAIRAQYVCTFINNPSTHARSVS